jgi:hypothetical protein
MDRGPAYFDMYFFGALMFALDGPTVRNIDYRYDILSGVAKLLNGWNAGRLAFGSSQVDSTVEGEA